MKLLAAPQALDQHSKIANLEPQIQNLKSRIYSGLATQNPEMKPEMKAVEPIKSLQLELYLMKEMGTLLRRWKTQSFRLLLWKTNL